MRHLFVAVIAAIAIAQPADAQSTVLIPSISRLGIFEPAGIARSARAAFVAGDYAGARRHMEWLTGNTTMLSADILVLAGLIDAGLDDLTSARSHFEAALASDRHHIGARTGLALTLARLGQRDAATRQLRPLVARQGRCAGRCADAVLPEQSVAVVRRAVGT